MTFTMLADKNNDTKQELNPCNRSIVVCGINSKGEEENVDAVMAMEKRPTWDAYSVRESEASLY